MLLFRITHNKYASDLSGTGGLFGPGRWHREGTRILYLSERISLAKLEVLANSPILPVNQSLITVEIPDDASILHLQPESLPITWASLPYRRELADITESWIREGQYWAMRVPSVHATTEYNYLLNPLHPEHQHLQIVHIETHVFDSRLK